MSAADQPEWKMRMVAWLSKRVGAPTEVAGPAKARAASIRTTPEWLFGRAAPLKSVADEKLAGVGVRRYLPEGARDGVIVYFHGGGWVVGDLESHDKVTRTLAAATGHEVLAVDYRRAPEHRFPAALDDCLAVTRALVGSHQAVAVAGDSAGGNMAAVVAQALAAEHRPLKAQVLVHPITDGATELPSYERWADEGLLTRSAMRYFLREYVPDDAKRADPRVSPLRGAVGPALAPAYLLLAPCDVLFDEGLAYAEKLKQAGVPTELDVVPGMMHGFFNLQGMAAARQAMGRVAAWLTARLAR